MTLRGAIVDLDGTVYRGERLLTGAGEAIDRLRAVGLSILFFSNNPTREGTAYVERLRGFGLDVRPGEACSAGDVTTTYLRRHHPAASVLVVGSEGLREQLEGADLHLTTDPGETDVLVGSWTPEFDYEDMRIALKTVDADTVFLGTDPDRTFPADGGGEIPGSGAVVGALAATVGRDPDEVLGKPSEQAVELALERLGVPARDCLVVGDRLNTDIAMGHRAGMTTALVCSGIAGREDVTDSDVDPDYVLDSLADVDAVLQEEQ